MPKVWFKAWPTSRITAATLSSCAPCVRGMFVEDCAVTYRLQVGIEHARGVTVPTGSPSLPAQPRVPEPVGRHGVTIAVGPSWIVIPCISDGWKNTPPAARLGGGAQPTVSLNWGAGRRAYRSVVAQTSPCTR